MWIAGWDMLNAVILPIGGRKRAKPGSFNAGTVDSPFLK
jgi:hypothetical protein